MVLRVGRQRGLGWALVEQSSMENWVCDGGVRRLHRGAERHRRGTRCGAVALAMVMEPDATCRRAEDVAEVRHALTRHDSSGAPDEHTHLICYGALSGPA